MSQSNKQIAVASLRQVEADLLSQLNGIQAAIASLGGAKAPTAKSKTAAPKRKAAGGGGMTPGIQAALDARAVKSGKATPEQVERHNARVAAKEAKAASVPEGASLAEAAAG